MDDDHRRLLVSILERLDAQIPRLGSIDTRLDGIDTRLDGIDTRLDGIDTRLDGIDKRFGSVDARLDRLTGATERLDRSVAAQRDQLHTMAEGMAVIAGAQADLAHQVGMVNERLARMVETSIRGRTFDVERVTALEARVGELELQVRALSSEPAR